MAAATRARTMARGRLGPGRAQEIARGGIAAALSLIGASLDPALRLPVTDRPTAERALWAWLLWRLRVLAGWLPPEGSDLLRALAAVYERDNVVDLARTLAGAVVVPDPWPLGGLETAWTRLREAPDLPALRDALARSPWGRVDAETPDDLRDELTAAWLRRIAVVEPSTRAWAMRAAALLAARTAVVERTDPSPRLRAQLRPFLGDAWVDSRDLPGFVAAVPRSAGEPLRALDGPTDLWRAEAQLVATVGADAQRTLRGSPDGRAVVTAAVALLAVDAWRARAALAAAGRGESGREVLDVVA